MLTPENLRGVITDAADPSDGDDVATRKLLVAELGTVLARCPSTDEDDSMTAEPTPDGACRSPSSCAVGRRIVPACQSCLLAS